MSSKASNGTGSKNVLHEVDAGKMQCTTLPVAASSDSKRGRHGEEAAKRNMLEQIRKGTRCVGCVSVCVCLACVCGVVMWCDWLLLCVSVLCVMCVFCVCVCVVCVCVVCVVCFVLCAVCCVLCVVLYDVK